jgi:cytochrome oxidase Cu insertion factor (SCO1/SenC/PrrC family)
MTGMNTGVNAKSAFITSQFNSALLVQFGIIVGIVIVIAVVATILLRREEKNPGGKGFLVSSVAMTVEPKARKVLRIGFGVLWIIDGLLQLQPQMVLGLPTQVVTPTVDAAPHWINSLVTHGADAWLRHPITAASATVWLQVGLGIWLLVANRGWWSRGAGLASAAWGFGVWVLGNGLGGAFIAPISWTTGFPGAVLFYALAGAAIALPPDRLRRSLFALWAARLTALGAGYLAILQSWPGRGYWSGGGGSGAYPAMATSMGSVTQPGFAARIQRWFTTFTSHNSWLYNSIVVIVLVALAVTFFSNKVRLMRWSTVAYVVVALMNWVLVQDFAVFGGVGTDVNSMIPSSLFVVAVYLCTRDAVEESVDVDLPQEKGTKESVAMRTIGTLCAIGVFLVGAVPMLFVGILPGTSDAIAAAANGGVQTLSSAAPGFTLMDQRGQQVSLSSLRGKIVVMAFIDPVCTTDCPIEAQQMRLASEQLGPNTVMVAVDTNPLYRSLASIQTFNDNEGLANSPSWYFLTGSLDQLKSVWSAYGVDVQLLPGGAMVAHTEPMYVIDRQGAMRSTWTAVTSGGTASSLESQSGVSLIVAQAKKAQS